MILPPAFRLVAFDRVGSTNDEARRLAAEGTADLTVVTAAEQTAGRGRRGRGWVSPRGNLHFSVLIRLDRPPAEAASVGFAAAVALCEALGPLVPATDIRCKWPNDVLADGRKVAGMLLEAEGDWLVLGLGVDVAQAPPPDGLVYPATCLKDLGASCDADTVLAAFCTAFAPRLQAWRDHGFAAVRQAWLGLARGLGEPVVVRLEAETLTGTFAGLDEQGALLLDQGAAGMRSVFAGDVFFPGAPA
ncbi:MAG: biotin--[acetyl-CoA-carboxylase] ligase [Actinomycetota bacterium]